MDVNTLNPVDLTRYISKQVSLTSIVLCTYVYYSNGPNKVQRWNVSNNWPPYFFETLLTILTSLFRTCGGCANACKRILNKIEGVESVDADVEAKLVTVDHSENVTPDTMLSALLKWSEASGKSVALASGN